MLGSWPTWLGISNPNNRVSDLYRVPRASHPFKVYEPEPDRRSVCSVSSSVHGRTSTTKSVQYEPSSRGDSVPKNLTDVVSKYLFTHHRAHFFTVDNICTLRYLCTRNWSLIGMYLLGIN